MILLTPLLILAQALLSGSGGGDAGTHHRAHSRAHPHQAPSPVPSVRVTIVNATCAPALSLATEGSNTPAAYPLFPQGEWTANEPVTTPEIHYLARSTNGVLLSEKRIRFRPVSSQFLVMTGDLGRRGPADMLAPVGASEQSPDSPSWPPNFQFRIYPVELVTRDPFHYRVINAMPCKTLVLRTTPLGNKPSRILGLIAPGNSLLLTRQPPCVEWIAEVDGESIPLSVMQEGAAANCLIPFFLRDGKPAFVRVFESP
jgi:hypothetical protein